MKPGEPGRDRLQDEPQEPGEEEDEDQVGEEGPDARQLAEDDEEEGDRAEDEHDLQPAVLARRGEAAGARLRRGGGRRQRQAGAPAATRSPRAAAVRAAARGGPSLPISRARRARLRRSYRRPIFSWTSASVASTIGFRRAAPSSRTASTRSGCASSSA